ncbi:cysteine rich repeat-containing protein [Xanthobacter sp. AM11]|uniref:cysteine rich repeat-containing protein n=1 Tax=Xanthobacter sp. AM11 TaxID=3380643 RepID=UPI0039BF6BFC
MRRRLVTAIRPAAILTLPALFAGLFLVTGAQAQNISGAQLQALRTACEADVKKLCSGIQPGGGRLIQCLRQHQADVSPTCKDGLASLAAAPKQ